MNPKVSVIIPVYKAEKYIEKCVRHLFEQTLDNVEFIFVDDASPDSSINIVESLAKVYPIRWHLVKIIRHDENRGVGFARQSGLTNCGGEYITHCDPDDYPEPNWLEELYNEAQRSKADIVTCDFYIERSNGEQEYRSSRPEKEDAAVLRHRLTRDIYGACWNKLIRTDIIRKNNLEFVKGINYQEDLLFVYKALCCCTKFRHIDKALYHYNKTHESSITQSLSHKRIKSKFIVKNEIDRIEPNDQIRFANKYHICKAYEICELWTASNVSNKEYKVLMKPFFETIWDRKDLALIWKILSSTMEVGIGDVFRSIYLIIKEVKCPKV